MTRHEGLLVLGISLVGVGGALFASIWSAGVGLLADEPAGDAEHADRR